MIIVGTNSWCTIAFADTYFLEKWGASAWATLTNNEKTQLLIHAYRWINQQASLSIPASSTEEIVKQAQCEIAWYVYNYNAEHEKRRALSTQGVNSFRIGAFSENLSGVKFPEWVIDMLEDYLEDIGGKFPLITRKY